MNTKEHGYRILFPKNASLIQRNEEMTNAARAKLYKALTRERVRQIYAVRDRYERSR